MALAQLPGAGTRIALGRFDDLVGDRVLVEPSFLRSATAAPPATSGTPPVPVRTKPAHSTTNPP